MRVAAQAMRKGAALCVADHGLSRGPIALERSDPVTSTFAMAKVLVTGMSPNYSNIATSCACSTCKSLPPKCTKATT